MAKPHDEARMSEGRVKARMGLDLVRTEAYEICRERSSIGKTIKNTHTKLGTGLP